MRSPGSNVKFRLPEFTVVPPPAAETAAADEPASEPGSPSSGTLPPSPQRSISDYIDAAADATAFAEAMQGAAQAVRRSVQHGVPMGLENAVVVPPPALKLRTACERNGRHSAEDGAFLAAHGERSRSNNSVMPGSTAVVFAGTSGSNVDFQNAINVAAVARTRTNVVRARQN
jgi:hypothetical protein